ncbi:killer cell lectin-like receptor subfamily G member 1 isoform X3 [Pezoporus occidentalis]|uniref:killer cell lectin-like receptor subfamily G member 1 isoform X3 n=1 Tax=Pezoporus occidentalis TaxID=407982 RepID=UPI002F90888A
MHHLFCYHISASSCGNKENSDPDLDFVPSWTSKCQVKQSKKKQHLKAHDRNKEEHIYLNVKHSPSSKKQMTRRQRTEENITNKGYPCPSCPEQWVAYRGSCYSFSKQKKDWNSSRQSCGAQGAHLLVISDTSEMDFFQMMHTESYWIGLQNSTGYDWVWEDGSKLNGKNVLFNSPVQNCGVLLDGAIRASSCEILAPWICEKSLQ